MCASLLATKIDLNWADNQHLSTLIDIVGEYSKLFTKKEKKKVNAEQMKRFIRKDEHGNS